MSSKLNYRQSWLSKNSHKVNFMTLTFLHRHLKIERPTSRIGGIGQSEDLEIELIGESALSCIMRRMYDRSKPEQGGGTTGTTGRQTATQMAHRLRSSRVTFQGAARTSNKSTERSSPLHLARQSPSHSSSADRRDAHDQMDGGTVSKVGTYLLQPPLFFNPFIFLIEKSMCLK